MKERIKKINLLFYYSGDRGQDLHYLPVSTTSAAGTESSDPAIRFHREKWNAVIRHILSITGPKGLPLYSGQLPPNLHNERYIIILLIGMRALSEKAFLNDLVARFRSSPHFINNPENAPNSQGTGTEYLNQFHYQPIITLGFKDIFSLFSEESHSLYEENKLLYDLHPDPRFKFLDSSIWNRYVPLYPKPELSHPDREPFNDLFTEVLDMMIANHEENIYATVPARSHLEFHSRMLLNSFIAEVGRKGHHETVTPFKFHSETQMAQKTAGLKKFFERRRPNGIPLGKSLSWKGLFIDDYADAETRLSIFADEDDPEAKEWACNRNKLGIIVDLINSLGLNITVVPPGAKDSKHIIDESCKKLEKEVFDILLVDYLLGYTDLPGTGREYGHDFLRALMEKSFRGKDYVLKRGPIGKFWVFPTSSFPLAFVDKMRQLGLTTIGEYFYLSNGGDPISTPEMFKFNLVYFLKQEVEQVYITDEALAEFITNYATIEDFNSWKEAIIAGLNYFFSRSLILDGDQRNQSLLAKSLLTIIREDNSYLNQFKADLEQKLHELDEEDRILSFEWVDGFFQLYAKFPSLIRSLGILFRKLLYFNRSRGDLANKEPTSFARSKLWFFEPDFDQMTDLSYLNLKGNQLRDLPPGMQKMSALEELILDNNQFRRLPQVLRALPNLKKLSIKGTPIAEIIGRDTFENKQEIKKIETNNKWWHPDRRLKVYIAAARADLSWKNQLVEHLNLIRDLELFDFDLQAVQFPNGAQEELIPGILEKEDTCLIVLTSLHFLKHHAAECNVLEKRMERTAATNVILIDEDQEGQQFLSIRRPACSLDTPLACAELPDDIIFGTLLSYLKGIHRNWIDRGGWSDDRETTLAPSNSSVVLIGADSSGAMPSASFLDLQALQNILLQSGLNQRQIHIQYGRNVNFQSTRSLPAEFLRNGDRNPDPFLLYLGGYRVSETSDGEYLFTPSTADPEQQITSSSELRQIIQDFQAKNTVVFLNGYHSVSGAPTDQRLISSLATKLKEKLTPEIAASGHHFFISLTNGDEMQEQNSISMFLDCLVTAILKLRRTEQQIMVKALETELNAIVQRKNSTAKIPVPAIYSSGNSNFIICR